MPKKKVKDPFFHISQPGIKFPEANMQEVFSSKLVKKQAPIEVIHNDEEELAVRNKNDELAQKKIEEKWQNHDQVKDVIEEFEAQRREKPEASTFSIHLQKKPGPSFKRLKSFKEMDTLERLNYLYDFPKQLPPVGCIFETEEQTIRGHLVRMTEESIDVSLFNGNMKTLPISAIKEVKMAGFRG